MSVDLEDLGAHAVALLDLHSSELHATVVHAITLRAVAIANASQTYQDGEPTPARALEYQTRANAAQRAYDDTVSAANENYNTAARNIIGGLTKRLETTP